jgi:Domain of unknown function (DUF5664)
MSGGTKHDASKEPLDLIPYEALQEIAKVLDFGAKKYARANWAKGINYSRLISAILRHVNQFNAGEDVDPESGISHMAHAGCGIVFLLWTIKHRPDLDDRWSKTTPEISASTTKRSELQKDQKTNHFSREQVEYVDKTINDLAEYKNTPTRYRCVDTRGVVSELTKNNVYVACSSRFFNGTVFLKVENDRGFHMEYSESRFVLAE